MQYILSEFEYKQQEIVKENLQGLVNKYRQEVAHLKMIKIDNNINIGTYTKPQAKIICDKVAQLRVKDNIHKTKTYIIKRGRGSRKHITQSYHKDLTIKDSKKIALYIRVK